MAKTLAICGLGGSGCEILDLSLRINAVNNRFADIVFVDKSEHEAEFRGYKVYAMDELESDFAPDDLEFVISVGDVYLREKIYKEIQSYGYQMTNLIAPSVSVPESTTVGEGVIIRDFCYLSVDACIGANALIQPNTCIGHNVTVGEHSIISAQSVIAGGTQIGNRVFIA
ncbi:MAG: hypothetical protein K6E16_10200, partial [Lachnospiraceae bacterium]|nr:hypothetical protein [Lachnospiraceae bacterium]